jgi:hypothetical protein
MENLTDEQIMKMPGLVGNTLEERRASVSKILASPDLGILYVFFLYKKQSKKIKK